MPRFVDHVEYRRNESDASAMQRICTCFFVLIEEVSYNEPSAYSEEFGEGCRQVDEVNRLRDVVAKARLNALILNVRHDIRRQRDDRHGREPIHLFPFSDFSAGLIAVFPRHVEIALGKMISTLDMMYRPRCSTLTKISE